MQIELENSVPVRSPQRRKQNDDFPGTTEPKEYVDIAKHITPTAAAAVLGSAPLNAQESSKRDGQPPRPKLWK